MANEVATQANTSVVDGYSSISGSDMATRKRIYTATSNAEKLSDHLDEILIVTDVIVQPVTSENEKTGELEGYLRTVLILDTGKAVATGSDGVINSLNTLFKTVGEPGAWGDEGLAIRVKEVRGNKGYRYMTVDLVSDADADAFREAREAAPVAAAEPAKA